MTIEEKAKAYDEAIKRAKPLMLDTNFSMKNTVISIFPELKENEDERMATRLIRLIHTGGYLEEPIRNQILAWLEKQKAKDRLDRMAPIYNDKELFESALEKAWKYYNESASRTVDSFEDDYIECVFSKGFREGFLYKENQKEQKPVEWSEKEMADCMKLTISAIEYDYDVDNPIRYKLIDWLKSLLSPQLHKEIYQAAKHDLAVTFMNYFDKNKPKDKMCLSNSECEDIDKAFKENDLAKIIRYINKYSWKPSKEQMYALQTIYEYLSTSSSANIELSDMLRKLYNDLQKLL